MPYHLVKTKANRSIVVNHDVASPKVENREQYGKRTIKKVHTMKTIIRKGLEGFGKVVGCEEDG